MDIKTISVALAIVTVSAVIFGALLPMFQDVTATEDTFTNDGYFYVDSVAEGNSINYRYENSTLYINGEQFGTPVDNTYSGLTVMYTENLNIRYDGTMKMRGILGNHNAQYLNLTVSAGTITGEWQSTGDTPSQVSTTYTTFYGIVADKSERVMCKSPQYVNESSYISASGITQIASTTWAIVNIDGSIADGLTINLHKDSNGTVLDTFTVKDYTIDYSEVSGYEDLYQIDKIDITVTDGENDDDMVYTIFTVPTEVTAERSVHVNGPTGAIIDLIPLIVALSIVILAVGWFITRKL